jgi:hypothetical protein
VEGGGTSGGKISPAEAATGINKDKAKATPTHNTPSFFTNFILAVPPYRFSYYINIATAVPKY